MSENEIVSAQDRLETKEIVKPSKTSNEFATTKNKNKNLNNQLFVFDHFFVRHLRKKTEQNVHLTFFSQWRKTEKFFPVRSFETRFIWTEKIPTFVINPEIEGPSLNVSYWPYKRLTRRLKEKLSSNPNFAILLKINQF